MFRTIVPAALFGLLMAGPSSAAVLDFIAFSNNNEHGVSSGTSITSPHFDGATVTFFANSTFNPYFDHANAGLGVCKVVNNPGPVSGGNTDNRCSSGSSDDNVTVLEAVTIAWNGARTLSNLLFTGEFHGGTSLAEIEFLHLEKTAADAIANGTDNGPRADKTLLFGINGGPLSRYTFAGLTAASQSGFANVTSATFAFDDNPFLVSNDNGLARNNEQFYLAAATISAIPLPAGLPLLLGGLAGIGLLRTRRKRA